MPTSARTASPASRPEGPAAQVKREVYRVAAAFGLYLIARPLWSWSGLELFYRETVLGVARALFLPNQHFRVVLAIDPANASNLDFVLVFTLCLLVVSTDLRWPGRVKWLALTLPLLFGLHVVSTILRVRLASAGVLEDQYGLTVLLPWEFYLVDTSSYLIYDLGLQLWPFLLLVLTSSWMREAGRGRRGAMHSAKIFAGWKKLCIVAGLLAALAVTVEVVNLARERDSRHVAAHARAGHLFFEARNERAAREHYEIAFAGRATDPDVYLNLSVLMQRRGELDLARRTLVVGEGICALPACKSRFADSITRMDRTR